MKRHSELRKSLVEYVRGELPSAQDAEVRQHLINCQRCRTECEMLEEILHAMPLAQVPPSGHQPDRYWDTFARRVDVRMSRPTRRAEHLRAFLDDLAAYLRPRWKPVLTSAGIAVIVLATIRIWLASPHEGPPGIPGREDATILQAAQREEVDDYFERSRILLIGIANIPAEEGDKLDLSVERDAARKLVRTARYLERKPIDTRSRELIRELERVLIELANLEERADIPEVDVIRTGVQQQNLLFKIRMAEDQKR